MGAPKNGIKVVLEQQGGLFGYPPWSLWRCRGEYFRAEYWGDGCVQVWRSDPTGQTKGEMLTGFNTDDEQSAIEKVLKA